MCRQVVAFPYAAGQVLELTVSFARAVYADYNSFVSLELRGRDNRLIALETVPAQAMPVGSFEPFRLRHVVPYGADYLGQRVRVALRFSGAGASPAFDNVSLCMTDLSTTTSTTTSTTSTSSTSSTTSTTSTTST